uniref:Sodium-dependent lysophosphatidylcholine symporter 1-B-like isoform X1 n=2 Tax=Petromyzon marinus TaxID=7757 RepID=A0AAJ7WUK3_PETMA|nr:sodium-dependent lysophosphatidylcholine symporter 1-B-like isoform X1 [Petromyzon marinus]
MQQQQLQQQQLQQQLQQQQQNGGDARLRGAALRHPTQQVQRLSRCTKLCFAVGGAPYQITENVVGFYLTIFLLDVVKMHAHHVSLILFVGRAWDACTDPAVGLLLGRSPRTRIGRFMPWIVCSTPFAVIFYFLLWYVPNFHMETSSKVWWYLVSYCLFKTFLNTLHVPYAAMTMFLSRDSKERDSATAHRMTLELVGILVGALVQGLILQAYGLQGGTRGIIESNGTCTSPHAANASNSSFNDMASLVEAYKTAAVVIGSIYLACIIVLFLGVREIKDSPNLNRRPSSLSLHRRMRRIFTYRPYLLLMGCYVSTSIALQLVQGNLALFFEHVLCMKGKFQIMVITVLVSAVLFLPVSQWMLKRIQKKNMIIFGMLWWIPFLITIVLAPSSDPLAFVVCAASGITVATASFLPWSMLPDTITDFRQRHGDYPGQEALFYSFFVFFNKFAVGATLGISNLCLSFAGYVPRGVEQPKNVMLTLQVLMAPAPIILSFVGIAVLYPYRLGHRPPQSQGAA